MAHCAAAMAVLIDGPSAVLYIVSSIPQLVGIVIEVI